VRAIVYREYGPPDVLRVETAIKPAPKADEVLVRINATSLNLSDWEILTGRPLYARVYGLLKPRIRTLGTDIAGVIEVVGNKVTRFKTGEAVFGDIFETFGGLAEYVCVPEKLLTAKPANLSFAEAAALPQAACIALQGIRDVGKVKAGQQVLINGGGGGSGSFAIQFAKLYGAEVTAVDNSEKLETMRALGADHVIDYTREDFTRNGRQYDMIFDLAAYHSMFDYRRSLKSGGVYAMVGGGMSSLWQLLFIGMPLNLFGRKRMSMLALKNNQGLNEIASLVEAGKVKPVIDKCFPLEQAADALRYLGAGHARGKVVVTMRKTESENNCL